MKNQGLDLLPLSKVNSWATPKLRLAFAKTVCTSAYKKCSTPETKPCSDFFLNNQVLSGCKEQCEDLISLTKNVWAFPPLNHTDKPDCSDTQFFVPAPCNDIQNTSLSGDHPNTCNFGGGRGAFSF